MPPFVVASTCSIHLEGTSVCALIRKGQHSILFPRKTFYKPCIINSTLALTLHSADCTYASNFRSSQLIAVYTVRQTPLHTHHSDQHHMPLQPPLQFATWPAGRCALGNNMVHLTSDFYSHSKAFVSFISLYYS